MFLFAVIALLTITAVAEMWALRLSIDTNREVHRMNANFQNVDEAIAGLQTEVANEETVINGAVTLVRGIPDLIQTAVDAALSAGATRAQLQAFDDLNNKIDAKAKELAAAVASAPSGNVQPGEGVKEPAPTT